MAITRFEDLDLSRQYTYADYLTWKFSERVELLRGWVARMSPAPNRYHQEISAELTLLIKSSLRSNPCKLYAAPFDVRLPRTNGGETVVQPDLCIVCDESKLTEQGCTGAPDWVAEIVSPGNSKKELDDKFALYEEAGVREYWIVHPLDRSVLRYVLNDEGIYVGLSPKTEDSPAIEFSIFPDLALPGGEIFP